MFYIVMGWVGWNDELAKEDFQCATRVEAGTESEAIEQAAVVIDRKWGGAGFVDQPLILVDPNQRPETPSAGVRGLMDCPLCGSEISRGSQVCPACGKSIPSA